MGKKFKLSRSKDTFAIRSVDIDDARRELLICHHPSGKEPAFGTLSIDTTKWTLDLTPTVGGVAQYARFTPASANTSWITP